MGPASLRARACVPLCVCLCVCQAGVPTQRSAAAVLRGPCCVQPGRCMWCMCHSCCRASWRRLSAALKHAQCSLLYAQLAAASAHPFPPPNLHLHVVLPLPPPFCGRLAVCVVSLLFLMPALPCPALPSIQRLAACGGPCVTAGPMRTRMGARACIPTHMPAWRPVHVRDAVCVCKSACGGWRLAAQRAAWLCLRRHHHGNQRLRYT